MLEHELYDEDLDLCLSDDRVHGFREDSKNDRQVVGLDDAGSPGEQELALDSRQPKGRIASDPVGAGKAPGAAVADERSDGDSSGDEVASVRRQSGLHLNSGRPENKSRRLVMAVPKRRAAVGAKQDLDDEDITSSRLRL